MPKKGIQGISKEDRRVNISLSPLAQAIVKILASRVYSGISISDLVKILLSKEAKALNLEADIRRELSQVDPMLVRGQRLIY